MSTVLFRGSQYTIEPYSLVRVWGHLMGSYMCYIDIEVQLARIADSDPLAVHRTCSEYTTFHQLPVVRQAELLQKALCLGVAHVIQ
jgi:hypothetical protein